MFARIAAKIPSSIVYAGAAAAASALNFASISIWTRLLSPAEFGLYALVSTIVLFINATVFEWLRQSSARMLVDRDSPDGVSADLSRGMAALFLGLTLLVAAAGLVFWGVGSTYQGLPPTLGLMIALYAISEGALALVNTLSRFRALPWQFFWSVIGRSVMSLVLGAVLVSQTQLGFWGVVIGIVASQWLTLAIILVKDPLWRRLRPFPISRPMVLPLLTFGLPLILSSTITFSLGSIDRFLLQGTMDVEAVGLYAATSDIMLKTLVFAMMTINLSGFPALVRAYEHHGAAAGRAKLEQNLVYQAAIGLPAAAGFVALAPGLAELLLGERFRASAVALLPWVAIAALFRSMINFHLNMALQLARRTHLLIVPPVVALVLVCSIGVPLIHHFGLMGMAYAAAVSQLASWTVAYFLALRAFPFRLITPDLVKVIIATALMAASLLPLRHFSSHVETAGLVCLAGGVYLSVLLILGFSPVIGITNALRKKLTVR